MKSAVCGAGDCPTTPCVMDSVVYPPTGFTALERVKNTPPPPQLGMALSPLLLQVYLSHLLLPGLTCVDCWCGHGVGTFSGSSSLQLVRLSACSERR